LFPLALIKPPPPALKLISFFCAATGAAQSKAKKSADRNDLYIHTSMTIGTSDEWNSGRIVTSVL